MKTQKQAIILGGCFLILFVFGASAFGADQQVIKIATLAPEGSAWMQTFQQLVSEVSEKSGGAVQLKVYAGGILGDEMDMLRKMQIGQIQAAVLSAPGLATVFKELNVFQVPFLFDTYEEVDYILDKMTAYFKKALESKGYILLGWSEGGFLEILSTVPITSLDNLEGVKVWAWENAPMAKAIFTEAKISAIPLSIPDVLLGLQTGLVDVVYAPPAGAIALQWFTRVQYITDLPLSYLAGGIVVKRDTFMKLPEPLQEVVQKSFAHYTAVQKIQVRNQNHEAIQVMQKHGIKLVKPAEADIQSFKALSRKAMQGISSDILPADILKEVSGYLQQYRKTRQ